MTAGVLDARPPRWVVSTLNHVNRIVLPSRLGRWVRPFALLDFAGRRTGKRYLVPVGLHHVGGRQVVFTPAPWRANFSTRHVVRVTHLGRTRTGTGTLVSDPDAVATAMRNALAQGVAPRMLGFAMPEGHVIRPDDVRALDKALIEFEL